MKKAMYVSPISAFAKKSGKVNVVHDLSFPPDKSINDHISKEYSSVKYTNVADAVKVCQTLKDPWLAKTDLKNAYFHMPIKNEETKYLGFKWKLQEKEQVYVWKSAPYGLRSASRLFTEVATALRYIYINQGASTSTIFYIDDILVIDSSREKCEKSLKIVLDTCQKAGFAVQHKKTQGPSKVMTFLGLQIDTIQNQTKIDEERLSEIQQMLEEWYQKETCTKRELLSLLGKLNFCSQVISPGRSFMRRLIEDSKKGKRLHSKITLSRDAKSDIRWWVRCMRSYNGISWFAREIDVKTAIFLFSDASNVALAGICNKSWTIVPYTGEYIWLQNKSIQYRELYAAVLTVATFSNQLRNCQALMHIDNEAMQKAIKAKSSKIPEIMGLIRALYYYTTIHNIQYDTIHIRTHLNRDSDNLSRLRLTQFFLENPQANKNMSRPARILIDW